MQSSSYRPDIDGLRAIAVLGVVLFHFGLPFLPGGFLGVDAFFVISGFLIIRIIRDEIERTGTFRFRHFYLRRIRRLFPALVATLLASTAAAFLLLSPGHLKMFGQELIASILSVSNIYFKETAGYFDVAAEFKPLLHTWSLSVEEQFYIVVPLMVVWAMKGGRRGLFSVLAVLAVVTLVLAELQRGRMSAFYLTPFRAFEFALGALMIEVVERQPRNKTVLEALLLAGLVLIGASFVMLDGTSHLPGLLTLPVVFGTMLVIYAGRAPTLGYVTSNPLSVWIGKISYSFYLVHWPLLIFAAYVTFEPLGPWDRALLFALCFPLAWASWRFVEQPFRRPREAASGGNRPFVIRSAATAALTVAIGGALMLGGGLPSRLPPDVAKLVTSPERKTVLTSECQYLWATLDSAFQKKFDACVAKTGKAVLVFGDSHGEDLFHALAYNGTRMHVAGISQPGCRPSEPEDHCYYKNLRPFIERNKANLSGVVFTQKGSYLLPDRKHLPVDQKAVDNVFAFLQTIAEPNLPMIWVGPQWEPYFEVEKYSVMLPPGGVPFFKDNIGAIRQVDDLLKSEVTERKPPLTYVSKLDILGPLNLDLFIIDGQFTYSDTDHWAAEGEEEFGERLIAGSPALRNLFGLRDTGEDHTGSISGTDPLGGPSNRP
ncbi:acyltransferase [Mesorhizobium sp. RP14(2022)]|uniref:Acyltransferase n=1 Tax=Mesorhizobium liriopis TaxID=2953882 RepID=A0ABT1CAK6_9HYPH|nr:acyltransferase family protein [Mesorhizobium liriopis]MCO6051226.1 acyltransferase [Mesorhizobium liriopis]